MITITLYSRHDCHLCEQVKADLKKLNKEFPHRVVEIDIETDRALKDAYAMDIPVLEIGPYRLKYPFELSQIRMTLGAAIDRQAHLEQIGDKAYQVSVARSQVVTRSDRFSYWLSKYYMYFVNLILLLYVGVPFLAPMFKYIGAEGAANVIYKIYSPLCHQWGFRSWFLFGEQVYYPHAAAMVPRVKTFEEATGITDANDPIRLAAREYQGNSEVGYKVALCERDVAIYTSMLLFGLIFQLSRRRIKPLHWIIWVLVGLGPVGLDGFSQIISQLPVDTIHQFLPYRESTPLLRTLTGFLFGFTTAWFGFPVIEEAMADTRRLLAKKFAVVKGQ